MQGWTGFRGGLDAKTGSTGESFVHTVEFGKEIVFHVSTLLPYSGNNPQQLERKRHLGNDICNIVFQEDPETAFRPEHFKSKFNHIFAIVSPASSDSTKLRVQIWTKNCVPEYGPPLPNPAIFEVCGSVGCRLVLVAFSPYLSYGPAMHVDALRPGRSWTLNVSHLIRSMFFSIGHSRTTSFFDCQAAEWGESSTGLSRFVLCAQEGADIGDPDSNDAREIRRSKTVLASTAEPRGIQGERNELAASDSNNIPHSATNEDPGSTMVESIRDNVEPLFYHFLTLLLVMHTYSMPLLTPHYRPEVQL